MDKQLLEEVDSIIEILRENAFSLGPTDAGLIMSSAENTIQKCKAELVNRQPVLISERLPPVDKMVLFYHKDGHQYIFMCDKDEDNLEEKTYLLKAGYTHWSLIPSND